MNAFIWLGVAAIMALVEIFSLGLITAWFVIGGLAAFFVNLAGGDTVVQLVVFFAVSILCLIVLRPIFIKYRKKGAQEEQNFVGQTAIVVEEIDNERLVGRVETANGMTWAARSTDGSVISMSEVVVIKDRESITFIVERKLV